MKTAFWIAVIVYYAIVITKFYILPAYRRRMKRRMSVSAYKRYLIRQNLKSFNY